MTAPVQNIKFQEGQNWLISFAAHQEDGTTPLPLLSGSELEFRISSPIDGVATDILTLSIGDGITVTDPANGLADILVTEADQADAEIQSGGIYFYEIRATINGVPQTQIEGQLSVEESLFDLVVDPLQQQFHARFPEFTEDDSTISLYIQDAARVVNANTAWTTADKPIATVYLAAHLLMMHKLAASAYSSASAIGAGGAVRSISVEDRTVSFATPNQSTSLNSKTGLSQTIYGQQYLDMLRRVSGGTVVFLQRA